MSEPMTDERLAEIEARANAATPGPWPTPAEAGDPYDERIPVDHEGCQVWPWGSSDDMEFAYKARADVPDLIAEVRRLNVALTAAKALRRMHYEDYTRASDELIALRSRLDEAERKAGYWEVAKTDLFGIVDPLPD